MDLNVNEQPVQLCHTYSSMELKCLRDIVFHNNCYKTLPTHICKRVIDLGSYKKRRRGCRAGVKKKKQQNPRYADLSNLINI